MGYMYLRGSRILSAFCTVTTPLLIVDILLAKTRMVSGTCETETLCIDPQDLEVVQVFPILVLGEVLFKVVV